MLSNDPPSMPSIFMCAPSRRRHVTGVHVSVTPRRYCPWRELCTPLVPVAERLLLLQGVPAGVPVLLPRAVARTAVALDHQGHAGAPGARAAPRSPTRRAHA